MMTPQMIETLKDREKMEEMWGYLKEIVAEMKELSERVDHLEGNYDDG